MLALRQFISQLQMSIMQFIPTFSSLLAGYCLTKALE